MALSIDSSGCNILTEPLRSVDVAVSITLLRFRGRCLRRSGLPIAQDEKTLHLLRKQALHQSAPNLSCSCSRGQTPGDKENSRTGKHILMLTR